MSARKIISQHEAIAMKRAVTNYAEMNMQSWNPAKCANCGKVFTTYVCRGFVAPLATPSLVGWRCPSCGVCHAPWVSRCPCVPVPIRIEP